MKGQLKRARAACFFALIQVVGAAAADRAIASVDLLFQGQKSVCVTAHELQDGKLTWKPELSEQIASNLQKSAQCRVPWIKVSAPPQCIQPPDERAYANQIRVEFVIKRLTTVINGETYTVTLLDGSSPNYRADLDPKASQPIVRMGRAPLGDEEALSGLLEFADRAIVSRMRGTNADRCPPR